MRTFLKVVAVSSALLVAAQAVPAAAGDRHGDDMLAAGVAGLAAGVIAGAIVSGSNDGPREVQTYEEVPQYRQRPVYYSGGWVITLSPGPPEPHPALDARLVPALRRPLRQLRSADRHLYRRLRQRAFCKIR